MRISERDIVIIGTKEDVAKIKVLLWNIETQKMKFEYKFPTLEWNIQWKIII